MKRHAVMAALAFCLGASAQARVIDLVPANSAQAGMAQRSAPVHDLSVTASRDIVTLPAHMSELPEPEVFLMMLVGLVLIGYRTRRDSSDKFR